MTWITDILKTDRPWIGVVAALERLRPGTIVPPRLLTKAAEFDDMKVLELLLGEHKVRADIFDNLALNRACAAGAIRAATVLLDHGASPTNADGGRCFALPLSAAAANNHLELIPLLIQHGADVNENNAEALEHVFLGMYWKTCTLQSVTVLLNHGAQPSQDNPLPVFLAAAKWDEDDMDMGTLFTHSRAHQWATPTMATVALIAAVARRNRSAVTHLLAMHDPKPDARASLPVPHFDDIVSPLAACLPYAWGFGGRDDNEHVETVSATIDDLIACGAHPDDHDGLVWKDLLISPLECPLYANAVMKLAGLRDRMRTDRVHGGLD
ncbi:hypothetical protein HKX48_006751 [Thoreauomyces humboldtii]|nr:hypothetical protein HKX48_006751 [Thoreauomyces humboldtii]